MGGRVANVKYPVWPGIVCGGISDTYFLASFVFILAISLAFVSSDSWKDSWF